MSICLVGGKPGLQLARAGDAPGGAAGFYYGIEQAAPFGRIGRAFGFVQRRQQPFDRQQAGVGEDPLDDRAGFIEPSVTLERQQVVQGFQLGGVFGGLFDHPAIGDALHGLDIGRQLVRVAQSEGAVCHETVVSEGDARVGYIGLERARQLDRLVPTALPHQAVGVIPHAAHIVASRSACG